MRKPDVERADPLFYSSTKWFLWLLALSFFLRLYQSGEWSFWHDEALTVLLARKPIADLIRIASADVHPPLYFFIVKLFMLWGQNEGIVRLPSILCSTGAVLFIYLLGRDLFDGRAGLISALVMALSPLQLYYAQEARMYTQLVLLVIFSSWCLMRALRNDGVLWWVLLALGAALASYTSYFIFPVLFTMFVYVLSRKREHILRFMLSMGVVALLYLPWIGVLFSQTRAVLGAYWMERPHPLVIFTTLCSFFVGYSLPPFWIAVSLAVTLLMVFVLFNSVRHAFRQRDTDVEALIWLLLWGLMPLLGIYIASLVRPIFQIRTVMTTAPAFYLLVGWGLTRVRQKKIHNVLFLPTLLMMLMSTWNFYFNPAFSKPPWRQAAAYVDEHAQPGDVALHTSTGSFLTFLCYDHDIEHIRLPEDPVTARENAPSQFIISAVASPSQSVKDAVRGYQRAWLIVGLDHAVRYQLDQKQYFDDHYHLLEENEIGGIYILVYTLDR